MNEIIYSLFIISKLKNIYELVNMLNKNKNMWCPLWDPLKII